MARPRCCINVGVTGHRANRITVAQLEEGSGCVDSVLAAIAKGVGEVASRADSPFSRDGIEVRLLSALADGSDQYLAGRALDLGFTLHAVLPFPAEQYERDFEQEQTASRFHSLLKRSERVFEMPGERADTANAYDMAGRGIVAHADLLIAIWDGDPARGAGGTAHVMETALGLGTPVVRLDPANWGVPSLLWRGSGPSVSRYAGIGDYVARTADETVIKSVIEKILLPPAHESETRYLREYLREPTDGAPARREYRWLLAITGVNRAVTKRSGNDSRDSSTGASSSEHPDPRDGRASQAWQANFTRSDRLASRYGDTFRSAHVLNFFLAAFAVALAVAGLVYPPGQVEFIAAEIAAIVLLVVHTHTGRAKGWHRRWLDYRYLAERLRPMQTLAQFGIARATDEQAGPEAATWTEWLADSIWRETGIRHARVDAAYCARLRKRVVEHEILPQARYHGRAGGQMHLLGERLHKVGDFLFLVTLCVEIVSLFLHESLGPHAEALLTALAAALPALGGAIYGIRVQGDFTTTSLRSRKTQEQLERLAGAIETEPRFTRIAGMTECAAQLMLLELAEWRLAYRSRTLEVPA